MLVPSLRSAGSSGRPVVAAWVYNDDSLAIAYVDFRNTTKYITWHAPTAQQDNYDDPGAMNHALFGPRPRSPRRDRGRPLEAIPPPEARLTRPPIRRNEPIMSSQTPQYIDYDGVQPPYHAERKPKGCVFYGCLAAGIVAVLGVLLIGALLFFTYKMLGDFVRDYGEDAPRPVAVAELPADQLDAIKARVDAFRAAISTDKPDKPAEPLVLTSTEVNALIDSNPDLKGVVAADFAGDKIRGQVSFPLAKVGFPGRFLNGTATFDVRIDHGLLLVTLDTLEVKGKPIPETVMSKLRMENLFKEKNDPATASKLARIEKIEVKDSKLIITPKPPGPPPPSRPTPPRPRPTTTTIDGSG